jgi:flagellar hook assembly protein FlgD
VDAAVKLSVFNVAGEPLRVITQAGRAGKNVLEWDGTNDAGARCASGVYILRLQAEGVDRSTGSFWTQVAIQR